MTADLERLKALALAATPGPWEADNLGWVSSANGELAFKIDQCADGDTHFIAAANPKVVLDLVEQLQRAIVQVRELRGERDAAILERNAALVRAIKAEQQLVRIADGLATVERSDFDWNGRDDNDSGAWVLLSDVEKLVNPDPNDPLDDVLPLAPTVGTVMRSNVGKLRMASLPINLPASLDLPDTEGGAND